MTALEILVLSANVVNFLKDKDKEDAIVALQIAQEAIQADESTAAVVD